MKNALIVMVIVLNLVTLYTVTNHNHEVIVKERVIVKEVSKVKVPEKLSLETAKTILSLEGYEDFRIVDELPCNNSLTLIKPIEEGGYLVLLASE